ncbi:NADH dehydrogenase [ubiquinone] 1 alpha subcomplex subunit 5-like [Vespa mandarinia]|uniref:NADH dehydrogenase [ubiquinone] 1 alpha subcomplex subunit 5-like n=1 Tax=Vespa mandarinia TaxID=7446 RepID=UPI00161B3DBE|nr:NADH dehydrogenase [ubiquinone] 1 alpha subcomplex subunit 5-like [Vespa mandarinia]
MAEAFKKVTLTGLKQISNPYSILEVLNNKILSGLKTFPENYAYRQCTEQIVKERMDILTQNPNKEVAAEKLGVKYIEEVIDQAKLEVTLINRMKIWKPWENLIEEAPVNQWNWPPHK